MFRSPRVGIILLCFGLFCSSAGFAQAPQTEAEKQKPLKEFSTQLRYLKALIGIELIATATNLSEAKKVEYYSQLLVICNTTSSQLEKWIETFDNRPSDWKKVLEEARTYYESSLLSKPSS